MTSFHRVARLSPRAMASPLMHAHGGLCCSREPLPVRVAFCSLLGI